jgi:hypothetical protein
MSSVNRPRAPSVKADRRRPIAGGWRLEAGGWRLEAGGWRLEAGGWRLEAGGWRLSRSERRVSLEFIGSAIVHRYRRRSGCRDRVHAVVESRHTIIEISGIPPDPFDRTTRRSSHLFFDPR